MQRSMLGSARAVAAGLWLLSAGVPSLAFAEGEGGEGHAAAAEGHAGAHELPTECPTAMTEAADEACREYWENHINWFSFDYKAGADQAPEHRHMPPPFAFALINFAIFAFIMWKLAARPLADFVRTRHTTIRKDLDEAQALHKEAEARLAEYQQKIAGLDREIDTLLAQVKQEAEGEKARIIAEAERQAVALKAEAEAQIQVELRRMQAALKSEAVNAAIAAAEQLLATRTTSEDQVRLSERFVAEVEKPAASSTPTPRA